MSDQTATLAEALALLQTRLPRVAKGETAQVKNDQGRLLYTYSYANLAGISTAILPLLGEVGLSWTCRPMLNADGKFVLNYELLHVSGESREGQYPLPTSGTPQTIGGMITYARRYALCSMTGVAPEEDDDDAVAASQQEGIQQQQRRKTAQRRTTRPAASNGNGGQHDRATDAAEPPPLPGEDGFPDGDTVTQAQLARIHATFGELQVSDRDKRRTVVSHILKRTIGSTADLSRAEAGQLIDELVKLAGNEDGPLLVADMLREDGDG
jgi:ERF superfamily